MKNSNPFGVFGILRDHRQETPQLTHPGHRIYYYYHHRQILLLLAPMDTTTTKLPRKKERKWYYNKWYLIAEFSLPKTPSYVSSLSSLGFLIINSKGIIICLLPLDKSFKSLENRTQFLYYYIIIILF